MALLTADVVMLLPPATRKQACLTSAALAAEMERRGHRSQFVLGRDYPGSAPGECEPHFSLFMLRVDESEIDELADRVRAVAASLPPLFAVAAEWRHNPFGAPELHYRPDRDWLRLQQQVIAAAEPLRRGRLRDQDPAGHDLPATVARLRDAEPDSPQLHQLQRYGYDEVTDEQAARFSPHITFAWPAGDFAVDLAAVPALDVYTGWLDELAVYGMDRHGTCTRPLGTYRLSGTD